MSIRKFETYAESPYVISGIRKRQFNDEERIIDGETYVKKADIRHRFEDSIHFTKVYRTSQGQLLKGLNLPGYKILMYIMFHLEHESLEIELDREKIKKWLDVSQNKSYYSGIESLLEHDVLARKAGELSWFWINPNVIFNGQRVYTWYRIQQRLRQMANDT